MRREAEDVIECFKEMGIQVLFTGGHHRKLVVMDREIMYEGSLNVLSQGDSCEVMRRIGSKVLATEMLRFVKLQPFLRS